MNDTPITITKKEEKECDVRSICVGADKAQYPYNEFDPQNSEILLKEKITLKPILYTLEVDKSIKGVWDWEEIYPPEDLARWLTYFTRETADMSDKREIRFVARILYTIYSKHGLSPWDSILKELIYHTTDKKGELTEFCLHFAEFVAALNSGWEGCYRNITFPICLRLPICNELWEAIENQIIIQSQQDENAMSPEQLVTLSEYMLKNCPERDVDAEKSIEEMVVRMDKLKATQSDCKIWNRETEMEINSLSAEIAEARLNIAKSLLPPSDSQNKPIK